MFFVEARLIGIHTLVSGVHRLADVLAVIDIAVTCSEACLAEAEVVLLEFGAELLEFLLARIGDDYHELVAACAVDVASSEYFP